MALLRFEPNNLRASLATLGSRSRVAFALACSLRTTSGARPREPLVEAARRIAEGYASEGKIDLLAAKRLLAELDQSAELDQDDVASSYYALAAAVKEDLDSVIWAAQRAYDASDAQAQAALDISSYGAEVEEQIIQRDEVQTELCRQSADLNDLQAGANAIPLVIERAQGAA